MSIGSFPQIGDGDFPGGIFSLFDFEEFGEGLGCRVKGGFFAGEVVGLEFDGIVSRGEGEVITGVLGLGIKTKSSAFISTRGVLHDGIGVFGI